MRRTIVICLKSLSFFSVFGFGLIGVAAAQDNGARKELVEPVFRVPKTESSKVVEDRVAAATTEPPVARVARSVEIAPEPREKKSVKLLDRKDLASSVELNHPLDRAVELAQSGLKSMKKNIVDYTAILVRRERVNDVLSDPNYIRVKIRNARNINDQEIPFSIYMKFLKPRDCAGREVIWVDGRNDGNLIAHETAPFLKFKNFHLDPTGFLAMKGNRYPIYDAGLENLTVKLVEKAVRDRAAGDCQVRYREGAKINKRPCMVIEVKHPQKKSPYEFYLAKVYIDQEYQIPVRYVAYDWPVAGQKPKVIEEYTYVNVELNVGLTENDFSISNPEYNFAK